MQSLAIPSGALNGVHAAPAFTAILAAALSSGAAAAWVALALFLVPLHSSAQQQKSYGQSNVSQWVTPTRTPYWSTNQTGPRDDATFNIQYGYTFTAVNGFTCSATYSDNPASLAASVFDCWKQGEQQGNLPVGSFTYTQQSVSGSFPPAVASTYDACTGNYQNISPPKSVFLPSPRYLVSGGWVEAPEPGGCGHHTDVDYALQEVFYRAILCPSNADGDAVAGTCTCAAGYIADPTHTSCTASPGYTAPNKRALLECVQCQSVGDPIFPLTGTMTRSVSTGVAVGGKPIGMYYNTIRKNYAQARGVVPAAMGQMNSFGALWSSDFHQSLEFSQDKQSVNLHRGDGSIYNFYINTVNLPTSNGVSTIAYVSDAGVPGALYKTGNGWEYFDGHNLEMYNQAGQFVALQDANGRVSRLNYSTATTLPSIAPAPDYLVGITDFAGRSISFKYALPPGVTDANLALISSITDQAGLVTSFGYDTNANLTTITFPDSTTERFVYGNASFPWAMTAVIDEMGITASTYGYDTNGLAISTSEAGGVNAYSVTYGSTAPSVSVSTVLNAGAGAYQTASNWTVPSSVSVTAPNGVSTNWSTGKVNGVPVLTGISQPAGSGSAAASSAKTYDSNGNITSRTDAIGHKSCITYDALSRVTQQVLNLPSGANCSSNPSGVANSRTINTVWDPVLKIVLSESDSNGTKVVNTYNGMVDQIHGTSNVIFCAPSTLVWVDSKTTTGQMVQSPNTTAFPLLCERAVYPLLLNGSVDVSASPIVEKFTYDANGLLLTYVDPKGNITTNNYDVSGNLLSTVDPLGNTTTNASFDAYGRPLTSVDARGITSTIAYTPRGQVASMTISAPGHANRVTTFAYNLAGDLLSTTYPDGTVDSATYDALHRVATVTNSLGNVVTNAYDASGNIVSQTFANKLGVVQKTVTRTFDALGRLEQVTGAAQ